MFLIETFLTLYRNKLYFNSIYNKITITDKMHISTGVIGTQWLIFLPAVWIVGPYLHYGLLQVVIVQLLYGALAEALMVGLWVGGRWKNIRI